MLYQDSFLLMSFIIIKRNNSTKGNPCITVSNQSINCIPLAPPAIHFSLPQICGSGKNGAMPNVRQSNMVNFQSLVVS